MIIMQMLEFLKVVEFCVSSSVEPNVVIGRGGMQSGTDRERKCSAAPPASLGARLGQLQDRQVVKTY